MTHRLILPLLLCVLSPAITFAQPGYDKDPLSWDRVINAKFSSYCFKCHGSKDPTADIDLASDENPLLIRRNREQWELVLEALKSESMPPEDAKKLPGKDRELMVKFLDRTLSEIDCDSASDPGRPVLRRLNRTEYDNAVFDLTGLDLHLAREFPADTQAYGFDNVGDALTLTPLQVQQYHEAAQTIVSSVIASRVQGKSAQSPFHRTYIVTPSDIVAPIDKLAPRQAAEQIIKRFASQAFRRDADAKFIDALLGAYDRAVSEGADHETAVGYLLTGILVSPRFLMRVEADRPDSDEPYPVDDHELATRLSFFLWSRPPDAELRKLADEHRLTNDEEIRKQTRRMLADDRSRALVDNFFSQWLGVNELDSFQPDPKTFPEFDDSLRDAMRREVLGLLTEIIRKNRPFTDIIDTDYAFLNGQLAKHYDLASEFKKAGGKPTDTETFVRVKLSNPRRGGLLTSGAMLMLQSDPTRTNIPRRGNFVAGRILGAPPPPPPPEVPPLSEPAADGKQMTLRERLGLHRSEPQCAACHAKIDPLGFALENYDAIGRWRDSESGAKIDASGELTDGTKFTGPAEMKSALLDRKSEFRETFVKNLLVYALGRGLNGYDVCLVRHVTQAAKDKQDHFADIIESIVTSDVFRTRRNPEY